MAVAISASGAGTGFSYEGSVGTATWAFDMGTGSNRVAYLAVCGRDVPAMEAGYPTCGGSLMTEVRDARQANGDIVVYRLINPGTGSQNFVVDWVGTDTMTLLGACVTGAHQTTPEDDSGETADSTSPYDLMPAVSGQADGLFLAMAYMGSSPANLIIDGAGMTELQNQNSGLEGNDCLYVGTMAGGASAEANWTSSEDGLFSAVMVGIAPAGGGRIMSSLAGFGGGLVGPGGVAGQHGGLAA